MTTTDTVADDQQTDEPDTESTTSQFGRESEISVLPAAQPVDMGAIVTLREHVGAMRDAKFFAEGMCYTQMVPDRFRGKPADGAAAILYGAEIGLSPIASLRSVIFVNGSPGLQARTMKALLKSKGYQFKYIERTDTVCEVHAWEPGRNPAVDAPDEETRWTIEDCIREGWVPQPASEASKRRPDVKEDWVTRSGSGGKVSIVGNMKYITSPRTMLSAKATADVCREIAPHVLLGMPYSTDDLEDMASTQFVESERPAPTPKRGRGVSGLRDRAAQATPADEPVDAEVVVDGQGVVTPDDSVSNTVEEGQAMEAAARQRITDRTAESPYDPDQVSPPDHPERRKASNNMHRLFAKADIDKDNREDRLICTRALVGRAPGGAPIDSSNDLTDRELVGLVKELEKLDKAGQLGAKVTDLLNTHAIKEMEAEQAATDTESEEK